MTDRFFKTFTLILRANIILIAEIEEVLIRKKR